jgi:hypothetical protein
MQARTWLISGLVLLSVGLSACSEQKQALPPTPQQPAPPSAPANPTPAHLIREGFGAGGAELGMTEAQIRARLGEPHQVNKAGEAVVFMSYHPTDIVGVYFGDDNRVRMVIAAVKDKTWCTDFDVCLYREGDLAKLKARHGNALHRFVDRDGSVTYRLLVERDGRKIMTEYTPVEEKQGVVQVAVLYWTGTIDTSGFD